MIKGKLFCESNEMFPLLEKNRELLTIGDDAFQNYYKGFLVENTDQSLMKINERTVLSFKHKETRMTSRQGRRFNSRRESGGIRQLCVSTRGIHAKVGCGCQEPKAAFSSIN